MSERTIFKYTIPVDSATHLFVIPSPSTLIHVGCQGLPDMVQFWAEVPNDQSVMQGDGESRMFRVFGTGHVIPDEDDYFYWSHVGTTFAPPTGLVWHLYERLKMDLF